MYKLPELKYSLDALEPYIDKETVDIHHNKHHKNYLDNLNKTLNSVNFDYSIPIEKVLYDIDKFDQEIRNDIINYGGGFFNHNLYFDIIGPNSLKEPTGSLKDKINDDFGSFENFKKELTDAAMSVFGSGWAWVVIDNGRLRIMTTKNQDSPLLYKLLPILEIDVWEHAYYLNYQNRRLEYINNFFNLIDWNTVNKLYENLNRGI
jgi:Fe-Mn family superoxide dismutase